MQVKYLALAGTLVASVAIAQSSSPQPITTQDTVTVLGAPEPVAEGQSSRSVESIDTKTTNTLLTEPAAALRTDSSVDILMRGPMGVQSDVSIRGSSFEQTLVLLNGFRINDAETAHFNLNPAVPFNAIANIDVLHGAGSTLYGSDAVAGVVDLRTLTPTRTQLNLRAGVGSYGINQQAVTASLLHGRWSELLSGARDFSTGFIPDRDYRSESASAETRIQTPLGQTDLLLAASDRAYGANQFYGNYNSWERTKNWFTTASQQLGSNTTAAFAYRRFADNFILYRNNPAYYANNHIDQSWQGILRRKDTLGHHATLYYGFEDNADGIDSNSLGHRSRNRAAGYADLELRYARATVSAGLREEKIGGGDWVHVPAVSAALRATERLKLRASMGYGYRVPTFVDLYYSDPTTTSNPNLKPEHVWSYDGGADFYLNSHVTLSATGFTSLQRNTIDYVRPTGATKYQDLNLSSFQFSGAELSTRIQLPHAQQLRISYTGLTGAQSALAGYESAYVGNYANHNSSIEWLATLHQVTLRSNLRATQRFQKDPYATLDLSASRNSGWLRPYLQITNLSNTGYSEIRNVRMQGRAFVGGIEIVLH